MTQIKISRLSNTTKIVLLVGFNLGNDYKSSVIKSARRMDFSMKSGVPVLILPLGSKLTFKPKEKESYTEKSPSKLASSRFSLIKQPTKDRDRM